MAAMQYPLAETQVVAKPGLLIQCVDQSGEEAAFVNAEQNLLLTVRQLQRALDHATASSSTHLAAELAAILQPLIDHPRDVFDAVQRPADRRCMALGDLFDPSHSTCVLWHAVTPDALEDLDGFLAALDQRLAPLYGALFIPSHVETPAAIGENIIQVLLEAIEDAFIAAVEIHSGMGDEEDEEDEDFDAVDYLDEGEEEVEVLDVDPGQTVH